MDWRTENTREGAQILQHWQKLGRFRQAHPAVGAGAHQQLQAEPLVFARVLADDRVVVALDVGNEMNRIPVGEVFANGERLIDRYSGEQVMVENHAVHLSGKRAVVLLARAE